MHEEVISPKSGNQHYSIIYEAAIASRTDSLHNSMSRELCAPKTRNQQNLLLYEGTNAPKTKNQHSSIFYEEVELQELEIDQTEKCMKE